VREWLLLELARALASSGFVIERSGHTRSNLEDQDLETGLLELSVSPESDRRFRESLSFEGSSLSPQGLRLSGSTDGWEILQQTLFGVPDLAEVALPVGSAGERACFDAAAAGLLPAGLLINGRTVAATRGAAEGAVGVLVVARETPLSWLTDTVTSINNQSVDPAEIVILVLGSRLDYRLLVPEHLRGLPRRPYRLAHLAGASVEEAVAKVGASMSTPYVAVAAAGDLLLTDFLETTSRFLDATPEESGVGTRPAQGSAEEGVPLNEELPRLWRRSKLTRWREEVTRCLPYTGCLLQTDRTRREPSQGVLRVLRHRARAAVGRRLRS
jgi:hypothetical protein